MLSSIDNEFITQTAISLYIYTDAVGSNIVVTIMVNRVSRATVVCNGALYSTHDSEARFKVTGAPA